MGLDFNTSTDYGQYASNPNADFLKKLEKEKQEKSDAYEAAKKIEAYYKGVAASKETLYKDAQKQIDEGKIVGNIDEIQSQYASAKSSYNEASMDTDWKNLSLRNSIFAVGRLEQAALV